MKISHLIPRSLFTFICIFAMAGCQSAMQNVAEIKLKKDAAATQVPKDMGNGIRLDSVSAEGLSTRFSYTATAYAKGDVDVASFYKTVKADLLKAANTSPDMAFYKKNKVKVAFAYYFKNGEPLSTIIIKPEDYTK